MSTESRRPGVLGVHSLDHFAIAVPDLDVAHEFFTSFGLDVRDAGGGLDLHAFGHPHRWVRLTPGERKALQYISFGIFSDDMDRFADHLSDLGIPVTEGRDPLVRSLWLTDLHGVQVEIRVAEKSSPNTKADVIAQLTSLRGAPMRDAAHLVRPRRMSHALFFTPDLNATLDFYIRVLGLRLSDRSGPAAFVHGVHGSEHHMIAFSESTGTGHHHSAWDVGSIDDIGLGAEQMAKAGHVEGWGPGRHVLGSNYFHYVRDPWGSYCEYSCDMDYIPVDMEWNAADHDAEDAFYVWGPNPPADWTHNHEADRG